MVERAREGVEPPLLGSRARGAAVARARAGAAPAGCGASSGVQRGRSEPSDLIWVLQQFAKINRDCLPPDIRQVPCFFSQKEHREHKILARKPRYPTDRASAWELAAGRPLLLGKKPQVAYSGDPKTLPDPRIPRGTPRFLCRNRLPGVFFFETADLMGAFRNTHSPANPLLLLGFRQIGTGSLRGLAESCPNHNSGG